MGIVLGSLAFDILDRLTGQWDVASLEWFEQASLTVFGTPALWFGASLVFWLFLLVIMCLWVNRYYRRGFKGIVSFRSEVNRSYSAVRLEEFLHEKKLHSEDWDVRPINDRIIVSWEENDKVLWGGTCDPCGWVPLVRLAAFLCFASLLHVAWHRNEPSSATGVQRPHWHYSRHHCNVPSEQGQGRPAVDGTRAPRTCYGSADHVWRGSR